MSGNPFSYAVLRVVPRVERGERLNVGVVVFCRPLKFLAARTEIDEARLRALSADLDLDSVRRQLDAVERIAAGDPAGGPIAKLDTTGRWHWLVAAASTVIQPGATHTGLCADPSVELEKLLAALVRAPSP